MILICRELSRAYRGSQRAPASAVSQGPPPVTSHVGVAHFVQSMSQCCGLFVLKAHSLQFLFLSLWENTHHTEFTLLIICKCAAKRHKGRFTLLGNHHQCPTPKLKLCVHETGSTPPPQGSRLLVNRSWGSHASHVFGQTWKKL